jgi:hypothetical protein
VLAPLLDVDAEGLVLGEPPAPVTATLEGEAVRVLRAEEPLPPPLPPEGDAGVLSPVQAAAEAVAARLQSVFAEPEPELEAEPEPEPEPESEPESEAVTPGFQLTGEPREATPSSWPPDVDEQPEGPPSGDLFAANDAVVEPVPPTAPPEAAAPRTLIDDTAPFEFAAPIVQPLPAQPKAGVFSLVALAVLGGAFFGGGLFWALNPRAGAVGGPLTPVAVGWLAGLAGVGLFSVAVFLTLQRLAGDQDKRD